MGPANKFSSQRPPIDQRKFTSPAVEKLIREVKAMIADPELAWMFENCYPNTLDTTVRMGTVNGKPDVFVITGDIEALWLRDLPAKSGHTYNSPKRILIFSNFFVVS
jgi:uncharacterized protein